MVFDPTRRASVTGGIAALSAVPIFGALGGCKLKPTSTKDIDFSGLAQMAQSLIDTRLTPGLSLCLRAGERVLFSQGFGVSDTQSLAKVGPQTRFRIASVTKQFTATCVLKCVEAGLLRLDDPLARFFPNFPSADQLIIRDVLQHISGLGDYINGQSAKILIEAQSRDYTDAELFEIIKNAKPLRVAEPKTRWAYSNSGYSLLSQLVSKLTQQPFESFVSEQIFKPLGMARSGIDPHGVVVSDTAKGFRQSTSSRNGFGEVYASTASFCAGSGAISATAEDLCLWHHKLFNTKVLTSASLKAMLTLARLKDGALADQKRNDTFMGYGFGLGLRIWRGYFQAFHNGRVNGFGSHLSSLPTTGLSLAILINCDGVGRADFSDSLRGLRTEAYRLGLLSQGRILDAA